jgi:hypothetical protein
MAEQFLRAGKTEAGGTAMMPALLVSSDVPPPVRRYLIATAGKKRIDFYNSRLFAGDSRLIAYRNPFARQENSSITSDLCFLQRRRNTIRNGRKIDGLLTTDHLLRPNGQRRATSLLPIWLPNPTVLALNCPRPLTLRSRGRLLGLHQKVRFMTPCQSETKTKKSLEVPK